MEIVIQHMPDAPKPTIIFGFTDDEFSQCVYLRVDSDPVNVVKMGNQIYEQFVSACAEAVKAAAAIKTAKRDKG